MKRLSILPLLCYALMVAYAGYGAAVVGHWPYYAHPDPKGLPVPALLTVAAIAMLVGSLSVLLLPLAYAGWRLVLRQKRRSLPAHRTWVWLYAAGAAVWIADFAALHGRMPYHSIVNWILD
jgi:hypothetical protein